MPVRAGIRYDVLAARAAGSQNGERGYEDTLFHRIRKSIELIQYNGELADMKIDRIHLKAPGCWINDPNGFIYYKGLYHLFYQCFPYAAKWGTMHWGHAVSRDLVSWEHCGIALFPSRYEDQNGCFSGSAVEYEGKLYLYYTGVHYDVVNPQNIHKNPNDRYESSQLMISSEDGFTFDNFKRKRVIIPPFADREPADRTHTRDPKVWRGKDAWYMVLGSRTNDDRGQLLFYRSMDLFEWKPVNRVTKESTLGWMWECPDLFRTEGGDVLMMSPMGILQDGKREANHAVCLPVEFEEHTCTLEFPDGFQFVDCGLDLYAPQTTTDENGRRIMVGWMRMPEAVDGKWNGMFCIPRVVERKGGHIYFRVHPDVDRIFSRRISSAEEAGGACYKLSLDLAEGESVNIGGYRISRKEDRICTDRAEVFTGHDEWRMKTETPVIREGDHLDIYVDQNLVEIYVNNGEYVLSSVVYGLSTEIQSEAAGELLMYAEK